MLALNMWILGTFSPVVMCYHLEFHELWALEINALFNIMDLYSRCQQCFLQTTT